jgi:hypothetical protein
MTYMEALVIPDTHKLISTLQKHGFTAQQAEGIADAIKEIQTVGIATKDDVQSLREEIRNLKVSLIMWMIGIQLAYGALILAILALR